MDSINSTGCFLNMFSYFRRKRQDKLRHVLQTNLKNIKNNIQRYSNDILHDVKQIKISENLINIFIKEKKLIEETGNLKYFEYLCDMMHKNNDTLKQSVNDIYTQMIVYINTCKPHDLYKYIKHDIEKIVCFTKLKLVHLIKNIDTYDWWYHMYKWDEHLDNRDQIKSITMSITSDLFINPININKCRTLLKLVCLQIIKTMNVNDKDDVFHCHSSKISYYDIAKIINNHEYLKNIFMMTFKSTGTKLSIDVYIQSFDKKYINYLVTEFYEHKNSIHRLKIMYHIFLYIDTNSDDTITNLMKYLYICERFVKYVKKPIVPTYKYLPGHICYTHK